MPAEELLETRRRRRRIVELAQQLKEAVVEDGGTLGVSVDGQLVIEDQAPPLERARPPQEKAVKLVPVRCSRCQRVFKYDTQA